MQFDFPDHAQVLIVVGDKQTLPPIGGLLPAAASDPGQLSRGHPRLKLLGIGALVLVAFLVGQHNGLRRVRLEVASNAGAAPSSAAAPLPPVGSNYAQLAESSAPAPATNGDQIPRAFVQQLHQAPAITPPPGAQPANPAASTRAFGLED